jgi:hypothetical protein
MTPNGIEVKPFCTDEGEGKSERLVDTTRRLKRVWADINTV